MYRHFFFSLTHIFLNMLEAILGVSEREDYVLSLEHQMIQ